ncbi:hypothetical protein D3C73_1010780 [compost metagenome]
MTGNGVQEQAAVQVVVDLAFTVWRVVVASGEVQRVVTVGTIIRAVEITEIRLQHARADCPVVHQTQEVLLVELFQVAVVVLGRQVLGDLVVATGIDELVAVAEFGAASVRARNRHLLIVAGVTAFNGFDLATNQGQILDVAGRDLATLPGLRQQTTIVGHDHRVFRLQGAQLQFSLGNLGFGGQAQAGEIIYRLAIGFARENRAAVRGRRGTVGTAARIQLDAQQADRIDTETDGALGVTGDETQIEALAPLFVFVGTGSVTVVGVDVEVTQPQCCLAVFDKTRGACLLGQNPDGHSHGQGGLVHVSLLSFLVLMFLVPNRLPGILNA